MALLNLPPPPKFGTQGPETTDDWAVMYRWFQNLYQILLLATNNSGQAVNYPSVNIPSVGLSGQIADLIGLAQAAYARPVFPPSVLSVSYVADALPNPWTIPAGTHGQGSVFIVQCWSGPVIAGAPTGTLVNAEIDLDLGGTGDVTIIYGGGSVGSVVIQR